jgi:hypothetical protein
LVSQGQRREMYAQVHQQVFHAIEFSGLLECVNYSCSDDMLHDDHNHQIESNEPLRSAALNFCFWVRIIMSVPSVASVFVLDQIRLTLAL